jgi:hypothetical protein
VFVSFAVRAHGRPRRKPLADLARTAPFFLNVNRNMDPIWILLGVVGWALGLVFVLVLISGARAAHRERKRRDPFADTAVTKPKDPFDAD